MLDTPEQIRWVEKGVPGKVRGMRDAFPGTSVVKQGAGRQELKLN
jgi:hypothetical protein